MSTFSSDDLGLRPAQVKALERKARQQGQSTPEYVRWLIERDLLTDRPFGTILRPMREDVRKAGVTEDELDQIVDRARSARSGKRRGARR